jgi:alkyl hydroperoxide reductase subunit AhpF
VTNGLVGSAATGTELEVGGIPPKDVGVAYCPHNDGLLLQDASKNEVVIKKLISRFTKLIRG